MQLWYHQLKMTTGLFRNVSHLSARPLLRTTITQTVMFHLSTYQMSPRVHTFHRTRLSLQRF